MYLSSVEGRGTEKGRYGKMNEPFPSADEMKSPEKKAQTQTRYGKAQGM